MNSPARLRQAFSNDIDPCIQKIYHRTMASWVIDLLKGPETPMWSEDDPAVEEVDCPWRELYAGSILDD